MIHINEQVARAIVTLNDALCSLERNTGRETWRAKRCNRCKTYKEYHI